MPFPLTVNGVTYTDAMFASTGYLTSFPAIIADMITQCQNSYTGTSATSVAMGIGSKTFTTQTGKNFAVGQPLTVARTSAPSTTYMDGRCTAYDSVTGSITVDVGAMAGSGTFNNWTISLGGARSQSGTIPSPILEGGTGATAAPQALTNLGVSSVAQTLVAQTTQTLMRTTGLGFSAAGETLGTAASAAAQRTALGSGATGDSLFAAATAAAARTILGSGATGDSLFAAATAAAARITLAVGENHGAGSASVPAMSFSGDSNTGIFNPGADILGLTVGGAELARIDSTGIKASTIGNSSSPPFSFTGDTNTGLFSPGAGILSVTADGAERLRVTTSGVNVYDVPFVAPMPFYIEGLQLVQNTTDPSNDIDIGVGACTSSDNQAMMFNTATMTKRLDTTWSAGSGGGLLDTGTRALSTWYHIYAIYNPTTRVTDFVATATLGSPTMPSGFTKKRRIGSIYSNASNINRDWRQFGRTMLWLVPTIDGTTNTLSTTATNFAIAAPSGIDIVAIVNVTMNNASNNSGYVRSLTHIDHAPDTDAGGALANIYYGGGSTWAAATMRIESSSAQIRATSALSSTKFRVATLGYTDTLSLNGAPI